MTTQELQQKTDIELMTLLAQNQEELRKLRFGTTGSMMRNTKAIRTLRTTIAQMQTEVSRRNNNKA